MLVLHKRSCDLHIVAVRAASRFLNSATKLSPAAEDFSDPGGASMDGAGSLGGRFSGNGESSSPALHTSSATSESTRRDGTRPCFEWVL